MEEAAGRACAVAGATEGDGVEVAGTIAAKDHSLRPDVLNRKTRGVKLDRTTVIASELANLK